ncbi:MAG: DUF2789 domain-containing protein [Azonexus sp.]|nr:DUF2789 domain-containing protein [Azonexus sp.]
MDFHYHSLPNLFEQLGLPREPNFIAHFIDVHSPLPSGQRLADAPFWTPAQATFLREELLGDADWAEVIDELDARLRH